MPNDYLIFLIHQPHYFVSDLIQRLSCLILSIPKLIHCLCDSLYYHAIQDYHWALRIIFILPLAYWAHHPLQDSYSATKCFCQHIRISYKNSQADKELPGLTRPQRSRSNVQMKHFSQVYNAYLHSSPVSMLHNLLTMPTNPLNLLLPSHYAYILK